MERLPVRRHVRRLALLALVAMAVTALPGLPVAAQGTQIQPLDDTQVDFAQGTFQRTATNAGVVGGDLFPDKDGKLELADAGALNPWQVNTPDLPTALGYMGVTAIGNRLYTVGGSSNLGTNFTDAAYWARVDRLTGAILTHGFTEANKPAGSTIVDDNWINEPLPQAAAYMNPALNAGCTAETVKARSSPAVASFSPTAEKAYIYVVGGVFRSSSCRDGNLTSAAVQIGTVNNTTGDLTWSKDEEQRASYLPSQSLLAGDESWNSPIVNPPAGIGPLSVGVEGATASILTTGSGRTFLYVIGGLSSYVNGIGEDRDLLTPAVFYTRVNTGTGQLEYPLAGASTTPWARAPNLPLNLVYGAGLNPGDLGIYGHTAMVSQAAVGTVGGGTELRSAIFVTGGYTTKPAGSQSANAAVFRATVTDDNTGAISWSVNLNSSRPGDLITTEGQGRGGAASFAYGNKLYVLGGRSTSTASPLDTATIGVHDDRLEMLPLFGTGSSAYFTGGSSTGVIEAVHGLGAAVVAATSSVTQTDRAAWGYAIGGFTGNNPTEAIRRGKIGGSGETDQTTRIPDGWYYSRPFNIRFEEANSEARIVSVRWFTGIDRAANPGADLRVEFQRTKIFPCNAQAFDNTWFPLDGDTASGFSSKSGVNEVKVGDIFPTQDFNASCFRYRVYMTQNGSNEEGVPNPAQTPTASPSMFSINVEKIKPGDPDLKLEAFEIGPDEEGRISTFNLKLKNLNGTVLNTIPAQVNVFPVVLCVAYAPLDEDPPTLSVPDLPIVNDPDNRVNCAPIYQFVSGQVTVPGQVVDISGGTWKVNFDNIAHIPGKGQDAALGSAKEAFAVPGHYAVAALLDPFDLVFEGGEAKANNRGENLNNGQPLIRRFTITAEGVDNSVFLPLVAR